MLVSASNVKFPQMYLRDLVFDTGQRIIVVRPHQQLKIQDTRNYFPSVIVQQM